MLKFFIMKKKFKLLILLLFLSVPTIVFSVTNYDEKTIEKIMDCRYKNTSACYEQLFKDVDDHWVRLHYGQALMAEKKYDEALDVFKKIENYSSDRSLKYQAYQYINRINELKAKMKYAQTTDKGSYINDIGKGVRWENYSNIKIYIENEPNLDYLYEQAFDTWGNAIPYFGFTYVNNKEEADIICSFVDEFFDTKAGVTKYANNLKIINGKRYFNRPVYIEVSKATIQKRQFTNDEILSTMIHEVGHALGITGHSKNINDVMYFSTDSYQNSSISQRDINTIDEIYK